MERQMVAAGKAEAAERELLLDRRYPAGTKLTVETESDERDGRVILRVWKEPKKRR